MRTQTQHAFPADVIAAAELPNALTPSGSEPPHGKCGQSPTALVRRRPGRHKLLWFWDAWRKIWMLHHDDARVTVPLSRGDRPAGSDKLSSRAMHHRRHQRPPQPARGGVDFSKMARLVEQSTGSYAMWRGSVEHLSRRRLSRYFLLLSPDPLRIRLDAVPGLAAPHRHLERVHPAFERGELALGIRRRQRHRHAQATPMR